MKKINLIILMTLVSIMSIGQVNVYITSSGGCCATEKWMSITTGANGTGTLVWSQGSPYGTNAGYLTDETVDLTAYCGTTLYINAYDRYDDSWDGTTYEVRTAAAGGGSVLADNGGVDPDDGNDDDASSSFGDTQTQELESSESFVVPSCPCSDFTASFGAQNCSSDLTYEVPVTISSLGGGVTVDITDNSGSPVYFNSISSTGTYTVTGLSGTNTIKIVNEADGTCFETSTYSACDPCSLSDAPADEPCSAPLIDISQPFYGSTACSYTVSGGGDGPDNFCASVDNDSWLRFIPSDDTVELNWEITANVGIDILTDCSLDGSSGIQLAVFDGSCASQDAMVDLACNSRTGGVGSAGSFLVDGLTIGDEYFLYIDGYAGDWCEYFWEPVAGVAVLPPNDDCLDAVAIACGERDTNGIVLATDADAPAGCAGGGTPGKGVWYTVVGSGNDITVSTDNSETNFDTQINVYTGDCANIAGMVCVAADDDSGTGLTSTLTFTAAAATTYYIYVDGDGTAQGTFEIDLSCSACPADAGIWD